VAEADRLEAGGFNLVIDIENDINLRSTIIFFT
jgi:hypothetical protein